MKEVSIEKLSYLISQAVEKKLPKPIVFLGAGASKTAGIPLANEIAKDILERYKDSPDIQSLDEESKSYGNLMGCLTPYERNELLNTYIDKAKINVSHIYLAQLLINGYIDYVITVNFDNLMLRALGLSDYFPPTYDLSNLKDITTTSPKNKSVIYLHGQHHGLWLLNTDEEMEKVIKVVPSTLNSIKNQRAWIFIGYSGNDPIFNFITELGRFDNGLYWVTHNNLDPNDNVCNNLLNKANTNAFLIKGYDADSFILKLNTELKLEQPEIIIKPFTSLLKTLDNIVDIDDKDSLKGVKERLVIVKKDVGIAIKQFEEGEIDSRDNLKEEIDQNILKKKIIDIMVTESFNENKNEIDNLIKIVNKLDNEDINKLMSNLYVSWGLFLDKSAMSSSDNSIYSECFKLYKKATEFNPNDERLYNNWGVSLERLAVKTGNESLLEQSIEKYKKAVELNPKYYLSFRNWGTSLSKLAKIRNDESLYLQSLEKFEKAYSLNPKYELNLYDWGTTLLQLAKIKNDESLFEQAFEKFKEALDINPKFVEAYDNWGSGMLKLAKIKNDESLFDKSLSLLKKAFDLGGNPYNFACLHALRKNKLDAFSLLEICLRDKLVKQSFVLNDEDWKEYINDPHFIELLSKYKPIDFSKLKFKVNNPSSPNF